LLSRQASGKEFSMRQVTVTYASGEKLAYPAGVKAQDVIGKMGSLAWPLAAVLVNNELKSLDAQILTDCASSRSPSIRTRARRPTAAPSASSSR
jgi:hypothetical protein